MTRVQFGVVNMAETDVVVKEMTGTNQTIDIPRGNIGQVVLTIARNREPLKFKASVKGSGDELFINGEKTEYILDVKKLQDPGSFKGLVVHKEGRLGVGLLVWEQNTKK